MVDAALARFGALHVVFNNHGVGESAAFADITEEKATKIIDTNLKSLIFCFKYQVRRQQAVLIVVVL